MRSSRLPIRIIVLASGAIVASGRLDEVRIDPEVRRAYLG